MNFTKSFTKQSPLPPEALDAAMRALTSADLHRYQITENDHGEVTALEEEFAAWQGAKYCLSVTSGGQAMQIALRTIGVDAGTIVLTNAFTLAPVPGAIQAVGGVPFLVETTADLIIDLDDLKSKAATSGARVLLLSHMRGHLVNMKELREVTDAMSITVIEDCAHTMGATYCGKRSGSFGALACFSTQTYKHMNSGEGGFLTSDDPVAMARAIVLSGSYMNFHKHGAAPGEQYFSDAKFDCPNTSARMDELRASILRPQLALLDSAVDEWNHRYSIVAGILSDCEELKLPQACEYGKRVGSSLQFSVPGFSADQCLKLLDKAKSRGVELKWFGRELPHGFTSVHSHWRYMSPQSLPQTDRVLATVFDMRIPLSFDDADCRLLGNILVDIVRDSYQAMQI